MYNNSKHITVMKASKKNNQSTEVKNNAAEARRQERQSLVELCKQLRAEYGAEERINNLLCTYYKKLHNLSILKTRAQWEREGFKIQDTTITRFPAWGKPVSRINKETGESYTYFPVTHFYTQAAVAQA